MVVTIFDRVSMDVLDRLTFDEDDDIEYEISLWCQVYNWDESEVETTYKPWDDTDEI